MRIRSLKSAAVAMSAVLLLGGCAAPATDSTAAQGEIVIWHMEGVPNRVAVFDALAAEYNATHPDFTVTIETQACDHI